MEATTERASVGHTPGKWRMSQIDPRGNEHKSGHKVFMHDSGYVLVCGANQEANARLIAAAPALAEALREAERVIRWAAQEAEGRVKAELVGGWRHHADKARAALAAAGL